MAVIDRKTKYLQKQFSTFSDTFQQIISLPSSYTLSLTSSIQNNFLSNNSATSSSSTFIDLESLYELCLILKDAIQQLGASSIIHDFLLMLYVESGEKSPDLSYVMDWIKSRLWIYIPESDAELLIKYFKLFHPLSTENYTEYDGFRLMLERDPLLLSVRQLPLKAVWCEQMKSFIHERSHELFWDRAKFNQERKFLSGKVRSFAKLASGIFQSNKVSPSPAPSTEFVEPADTLVFEESKGSGKQMNLLKRQQSVFAPNTSWIERARSDSSSVKPQKSFNSEGGVSVPFPREESSRDTQDMSDSKMESMHTGTSPLLPVAPQQDGRTLCIEDV